MHLSCLSMSGGDKWTSISDVAGWLWVVSKVWLSYTGCPLSQLGCTADSVCRYCFSQHFTIIYTFYYKLATCMCLHYLVWSNPSDIEFLLTSAVVHLCLCKKVIYYSHQFRLVTYIVVVSLFSLCPGNANDWRIINLCMNVSHMF